MKEFIGALCISKIDASVSVIINVEPSQTLYEVLNVCYMNTSGEVVFEEIYCNMFRRMHQIYDIALLKGEMYEAV